MKFQTLPHQSIDVPRLSLRKASLSPKYFTSLSSLRKNKFLQNFLGFVFHPFPIQKKGMMVLGVGVGVRKLENPESVLMIKLNRGHPPGPGKGALICLISRPSTLPIQSVTDPCLHLPLSIKMCRPNITCNRAEN